MYDYYATEGKLKLYYGFADGVISIWDVESNEELQRILFLLPSLFFSYRTVKPLTEMKSIVSVIGELKQIDSSIPRPRNEGKNKEKQR